MLINDNYKIESNSLNVILFYKSKTRNGQERWRELGFFATPHNALRYLIEHEILGTGMQDLKTVCEKIEELEGLIKTLKDMPEVVRAGKR